MHHHWQPHPFRSLTPTSQRFQTISPDRSVVNAHLDAQYQVAVVVGDVAAEIHITVIEVRQLP